MGFDPKMKQNMIFTMLPMYLCVCRSAGDFINCEKVAIPYFICVATFFELLLEQEFAPQVPVDKLIVYQVPPKHNNTFWKKLHIVKFWDILTFVDEMPQYNLPNPSPPPFYLPRPSQGTAHTPRRQLFPTSSSNQLATYYMHH